MFFDLSPLEILVLGGLAVVLFGPDRLPRAAASAAHLLHDIRALRAKMSSELLELNLRSLLDEDEAAATDVRADTPAQHMHPDAAGAANRPQHSYTDADLP